MVDKSIEIGMSEDQVLEMLSVQTELFLRTSPIQQARLIVTSKQKSSVFVYRNILDMNVETLPPHNLSCETPCDILISGVGEAGFGFYVEHPEFTTPPVSRLQVDTAEMVDGVATFSVNIATMDEYRDKVETEMEERRLAGIAEQCSDLSRPEELNAEARPCMRVPPIMPMDAERSGQCEMIFDVGRDGVPYNVNAQVCSEPLFREASEASVLKWMFFPEKRGGDLVVAERVTSTITFRLADEDGNVIPEL